MRNVVFAFMVFIYNGMMPMPAQSNLSAFLKSGDIKGFVRSCGQNEELAIESLIKFSLKDTISSQQIWYDQTTGKDINPIERSLEGADRFYSSLKLKSYYWILQIYNSDYSCIKKDICVFIGGDNDFIFDYESLNQEQQKQTFKEILKGENKSQKVDFQYKKKTSIALKELEQSFENWHIDMKEKGLDYMRRQNISPIKERRYKIFNPSIF
jgi:hypothetical protein